MFSGYEWHIKDSSNKKVGPGLNYFTSNNVWVDPEGKLHLKITNKATKWYAAELYSDDSFGYGRYEFHLDKQKSSLNENVVLGLFTWDDGAKSEYYREIDIEFSKFGNAQKTENAKYVVQPYSTPGNEHDFLFQIDKTSSIHSFTWQQNSLSFTSFSGGCEASATNTKKEETWTYAGFDIPTKGAENVRINLWLFKGKEPSDGKDVEIVVNAFGFRPGSFQIDKIIYGPELDWLPPGYTSKISMAFSFNTPLKQHTITAPGSVNINLEASGGSKASDIAGSFHFSSDSKTAVFISDKRISDLLGPIGGGENIHYSIKVSGAELKDCSGILLDGDGDGKPGGNYVKEFSVVG